MITCTALLAGTLGLELPVSVVYCFLSRDDKPVCIAQGRLDTGHCLERALGKPDTSILRHCPLRPGSLLPPRPTGELRGPFGSWGADPPHKAARWEGRLSDFLGDPRRRSSLLEAGLLDFLGQEQPTSHIGANELVLRSTPTWAFQEPVGPVSPWAVWPPGDCTHEIGYQSWKAPSAFSSPARTCRNMHCRVCEEGGGVRQSGRAPRGQTVKRLAGREGTACKAATGSL